MKSFIEYTNDNFVNEGSNIEKIKSTAARLSDDLQNLKSLDDANSLLKNIGRFTQDVLNEYRRHANMLELLMKSKAKTYTKDTKKSVIKQFLSFAKQADNLLSEKKQLLSMAQDQLKNILDMSKKLLTPDMDLDIKELTVALGLMLAGLVLTANELLSQFDDESFEVMRSIVIQLT